MAVRMFPQLDFYAPLNGPEVICYRRVDKQGNLLTTFIPLDANEQIGQLQREVADAAATERDHLFRVFETEYIKRYPNGEHMEKNSWQLICRVFKQGATAQEQAYLSSLSESEREIALENREAFEPILEQFNKDVLG